MTELVGLLAIGSLIPFIVPALVIYLVVHYRMRFLTVNDFSNENVDLPDVMNKVQNETTVNYAYSLTKSNQFYLTNSRIVFFFQSILRGKYYSKYFPIDSVKNTEIVFKNPYGWLIVGGINMLIGFIMASASCSTKSSNNYFRDSSSNAGAAFGILLLSLTFTGAFGLIWYYLKGFYLVFDNGRVSGLFCRSREGLEDILKRFDYFSLNKTKVIPSEFKNSLVITKDIACTSCKSVITLEKADLLSETFVCPICSTVNQTK